MRARTRAPRERIFEAFEYVGEQIGKLEAKLDTLEFRRNVLEGRLESQGRELALALEAQNRRTVEAERVARLAFERAMGGAGK